MHCKEDMDEEIPKRRMSVEAPFINKHQFMQVHRFSLFFCVVSRAEGRDRMPF